MISNEQFNEIFETKQRFFLNVGNRTNIIMNKTSKTAATTWPSHQRQLSQTLSACNHTTRRQTEMFGK